jgi:hypothetical protein
MTSDIHQSNGPGIPVTRLSDIVARGQLAKVPTALQREDRNSVIYPTQSETLFEEENLADQMKAQKAASIIQQALHPDTVLFIFAANIFKDRTEAYKVIEFGVGTAKGFRPISMYGNQQRQELIVEAKFREKGDTPRKPSAKDSHTWVFNTVAHRPMTVRRTS